MYRCPELIKDSRIVIDRLHVKGHVGCSVAFNMNSYTKLNKVNSLISEQVNAQLRRGDLENSFSQKSQTNFLLSLRSFMFQYNTSSRE